MPHQSTLSNFLSIFIIALIFCNVSTCRATRLLPPMPESPMLHNIKASPPHLERHFPKPQCPMPNSSKYEAHPKTPRFPPWIQDPTKGAEHQTPPEHYSPPKFEEPKLQPKAEYPILTPQPKVPSGHELKPIPKPKWPIFTPTKHQVPALPPLHEMPSLLNPELAPMPSVALVPCSAKAEHN